MPEDTRSPFLGSAIPRKLRSQLLSIQMLPLRLGMSVIATGLETHCERILALVDLVGNRDVAITVRNPGDPRKVLWGMRWQSREGMVKLNARLSSAVWKPAVRGFWECLMAAKLEAIDARH